MAVSAYDDRERCTLHCLKDTLRLYNCEQRYHILRTYFGRFGSLIVFATLTVLLLFGQVAGKLLFLVYTSKQHIEMEMKSGGFAQDQSGSGQSWIVTKNAIWVVTWAATAPFLLTFLASIVNLNKGRGDCMSLSQFLWALVGAAAHVASLSLLVFCILPRLDIVQGYFVTTAFGLASSVIRKLLVGVRFGRPKSRGSLLIAASVLAVLGHTTGFSVFAGCWKSADSVADSGYNRGRPNWPMLAAIFAVLLEQIAYSPAKQSSNGYCSLLPERNHTGLLSAEKRSPSQSRDRLLSLVIEPCKVGFFVAFAILLTITGFTHNEERGVQTTVISRSSFENHDLLLRTAHIPEEPHTADIRKALTDLIHYPSAIFTMLPLGLSFVGGVSACVQPVALKVSAALATPVSASFVVYWFLQGYGLQNLGEGKMAPAGLIRDDLYIGILWITPLWLFTLWHLFKLKMELKTSVRDECFLLLSKYIAILPETAVLEYASQLGMTQRSAFAAALGPDAVEKVIASDGRSRPMIYVCATVWHEQQNEMLRMLASIVRLDEDQARRKHAHVMLSEIYQDAECRDPDGYLFEAHVFIDDAMELTSDKELTSNSYVKLFVETVDLAVKEVFKEPLQLGAPSKCYTPYGGRLVWTLPGGNKMFVHLKDKNKVRNRKRWSQMMYMHYLFNYRRFERDHSFGECVHHGDLERDKELIRESTEQLCSSPLATECQWPVKSDCVYYLAIDGDVDFQPEDVLRLVGCLRRDDRIGAACGRIHPIGKGPVIWYQQFEYALGHWLQKSAEQVLGCVLCAPGAFSLFRASALMNNDVADAYASLASEARHYVQYEQGEDRWLTALLLRNGYRIEYVADAAVLSHAPESLAEFFSQRRRWNPSTVTHTVDFLVNWRKIRSSNEDITATFVIYQAVVFFTWLLAPASITALIADGLNRAFGLTLESSFILSAAIPASYAVVCFTTSHRVQVNVAAVMTVATALIMAALIAKLLIHFSEMSLSSFWGIVLISEIAIFTTTAAFHPGEYTCLVHGVWYYLCIVTGYVILAIYSVVNCHYVSWGTREDTSQRVSTNTNNFANATRVPEIDGKTAQDLLGKYHETPNETSSYPPEKMRLMDVSTYQSTSQRSTTPTATVITSMPLAAQAASAESNIRGTHTTKTVTSERTDNVYPALDGATSRSVAPAEPKTVRMSEPYQLSFGSESSSTNDATAAQWMNEPFLQHAVVVQLSESERQFWDSLVRGLLRPLPQDATRQAEIEAALLRMRNVVSGTFLFVNTVWMAVLYRLLTAVIFDDKSQRSLDDSDDYSETASVCDVAYWIQFLIYLTVLAVQYLCMLRYRWKNPLKYFISDNWLPPQQLEESERQQYTVGGWTFALPLRWCKNAAQYSMAVALKAVRRFHYGMDSKEDDGLRRKCVHFASNVRSQLCCTKGERTLDDDESGEPMFIELASKGTFELRNRFEEAMNVIRKYLLLRRTVDVSPHRDERKTRQLHPAFGAASQWHANEFTVHKAVQDRSWSAVRGKQPAANFSALANVEGQFAMSKTAQSMRR